MIEPFLSKEFIAIILVASSCALLGVFVLWKKLSFFGDALSHSILLGLVVGGIFNCSQIIILAVFSVIFAFLLNSSFKNNYFSKDTIIAVFSYLFVSFAMILSDVLSQNFDLHDYVFGDISSVVNSDIIGLLIIFFVVATFSFFAFKKILLISINQDLAKLDGIKCEFWNLFSLILLSLVIAFSARIVGIFLMTALLILPAAIARIFSVSAKRMMILSLIIAIIFSAISFVISNSYNITISSLLIAMLSLVFVSFIALKNE